MKILMNNKMIRGVHFPFLTQLCCSILSYNIIDDDKTISRATFQKPKPITVIIVIDTFSFICSLTKLTYMINFTLDTYLHYKKGFLCIHS